MKSRQRRVATSGWTIAIVAIVAGSVAALSQQTPPPLRYPSTHRGGQIDDVNGVRVADPYRWLEDATSANAKSWIAAQNALTESFLSPVPARQRIRERLTSFFNYPKLHSPVAGGERVFFAESRGLNNQPTVYVR